jgi:hypothetical protein
MSSMSADIKVILFAILGGTLAGIARLLTYLLHKTPAIGFDGPAGASFGAAILGGTFLFAIIGIVLAAKDKF